MTSFDSRASARWPWVLLIAIVLLASGLRLAGATERPFHNDEAVNSILVERLWQRGEYAYSPDALHGPSLPYLTLPFVWATATEYADTTELTYRALPIVLGLVLVALTFALKSGIGSSAALAAALLCAVSPAMVFYSRYYIHEIPLVVFSFASILAGWKLLERTGTGQAAWGLAVGLGVSLGLMHATKETFVIVGAAAALGLVAAVGFRRPSALLVQHGLVAVGTAMLVSILFFSSFFSNASGPIDSVTALLSSVAEGTNTDSVHDHPWYWYLKVLFFQERGGVLFTPEAGILLLALVGGVAAIQGWGLNRTGRSLARFFAVYSLVQLLVYSALPYKTPWCMLGFLQGLIVLAGVGVAAAIHQARGRMARALVWLALAGVAVHLADQSYRVNFKHGADERSPYVYAHALADVRRLAAVVEDLALQRSDPAAPALIVFNWNGNASVYFYLRNVAGVRFRQPHQIQAAPIGQRMLLVDFAHRDALPGAYESDYHVEHFQLRPNIWGLLYVEGSLWRGTMGEGGEG